MKRLLGRSFLVATAETNLYYSLMASLCSANRHNYEPKPHVQRIRHRKKKPESGVFLKFKVPKRLNETPEMDGMDGAASLTPGNSISGSGSEAESSPKAAASLVGHTPDLSPNDINSHIVEEVRDTSSEMDEKEEWRYLYGEDLDDEITDIRRDASTLSPPAVVTPTIHEKDKDKVQTPGIPGLKFCDPSLRVSGHSISVQEPGERDFGMA